MNQLSFPLSRATDPLSSHLAADETNKDLSRQLDIVARFLRLHPNLTARELDHLYEKHYGEGPCFHKRLSDLAKLGLASRSETLRKCRQSGKLAITWVAA